jgi:hypothetical protein
LADLQVSDLREFIDFGTVAHGDKPRLEFSVPATADFFQVATVRPSVAGDEEEY